MKNLLVIFSLMLTFSASAQLPNGSTAPDFTLTDRDGVTHNLYTYLDQGKVVFIKFFACHCPSCWAYHNSNKLESIYLQYGPDGTDQIMVLMLEHDINNPEAFTGGGTYTQGNWETGNSIPMIDVEGNDRGVFDNYNLQYYPMITMVCTDKTTKLISTALSTAQLFQEADDCPGNLSIGNQENIASAYYDYINRQLIIQGMNEITEVSIFNLMGQQVLNLNTIEQSNIDLSSLNDGTYIVTIDYSEGTFKKKLVVR